MANSPCLRNIDRLASLALGLLVFSSANLASAVILFENDFEDDVVGTYTRSQLIADWNGVSSNDGVDEGRVSIVSDADTNGGQSLVVKYLAGHPNGVDSNQSKSQWRMPLNAVYDELYLSYKVRFHDDFDFVRGGKLPGLCGGTCNSGGSTPDGTDGWSGRMMWRTDGSGQGGGSPLPPHRANAVQYVYHPDQTGGNPAGRNGDDLKYDDTPSGWQIFDSDVWYQLQHRIVMNDPGQDNGIVQAWFNGEMVLDRQDLEFRDNDSFGIDSLYFSTFFGGGSPTWATTKDEFAYFDDFVISTEFINTSSLPGDYDDNGTVDASDYTIWRDGLGTSFTQADYLVWKNTYGTTSGSGIDSAGTSSSVPEPAPLVLLLVAVVAILQRRIGTKQVV